MNNCRLRGCWLLLAGIGVLCGCGSSRSGTNPPSATSAGVTAALGRYFDALRQTDLAGVNAALAPDYSYDPGFFDPRNPFDRPAGVRYRSLTDRVEALTVVGRTATAMVTTTFEGDLNLEILRLGLGRPPVIGSALSLIELEERGAEWKLTAVRAVRATYRNPNVRVPELDAVTVNGLLPLRTLTAFTVNGRTSLEVPPGAPLTLAGKGRAPLVLGVIGARFRTILLPFDTNAPLTELPWELPLQAPDTPGRFLVYAFSIVLLPDPATGASQFLTGDQLTVPVTVVQPR